MNKNIFNLSRTILGITALLILGIGVLHAQSKSKQQEENPVYKIMSFNIRMSGFSEQDGINAWANRKEAVVNMLNQQAPDIFGVQEMLPDQKDYLCKQLSQYRMKGIGRDDGKKEGECMAIFYLKDKFKCLDYHTYWLSETPTQVSRGWDAACKRTVTCVLLEDKRTKQTIYYFNTHLDHMGQVARRESVKLLCHIIDSLTKGTQALVILGGDMNSTIEDEIFKPFEAHGLFDARIDAQESSFIDTYNAFGKNDGKFANNQGFQRIDHFFYSPSILALKFQTIVEDYGVPYISDHYPIVLYFSKNPRIRSVR
ncbi:MAG: endonuclease/exonuclease/phosphatase family protein [Bacteroidales bacterium]|nr:endonuclease/exonuclease/phosphatase family protein [Bacteroidales bacterium]